MVQLTDELIDLLDQQASRRGVSRSALIREAIETLLADDQDAAITAAIVEGYRRVPPHEPDAWGDLDRSGQISTEESALRLDAEERAAGFEPW